MSKKILAIDDSLALRMFISKTLGQSPEEFTVVTAKDGGEGIQLAQSGAPDLILLDYVLPDMRGDTVCQRLVADPCTAAIPVVIMNGNSGETRRAEADCKNIVKAISKPFTPDFLTATVRFVIRAQNDTTSAVTNAAAAAETQRRSDALMLTPDRQVLFSGRSDLFPVYRAFAAMQHGKLTGVLHMRIGSDVTSTYVTEGCPVLTTTKNADAYVDGSTFQPTMKQASALDGAMKKMRETAVPVFVTLGELQLIDDDQLQSACREHGARLLSRVWASDSVQFEFEQLGSLPDLCDRLKPTICGMDDWLLESLRLVGENAIGAVDWGDLGGVPIYTRHGYERIQHITVSREEAHFLREIGTSSLAEIAVAMNAGPTRAQEIFFRFLSLEVFEYWPAATLRTKV